VSGTIIDSSLFGSYFGAVEDQKGVIGDSSPHQSSLSWIGKL